MNCYPIRMTDLLNYAANQALDRWKSGAPARSLHIHFSTGHVALSLHQGADMFSRSESFGERSWPELVRDTIAEFERTGGVVTNQEETP